MKFSIVTTLFALYISVFPPLISWFIYILNRKNTRRDSILKLNQLVLELMEKIYFVDTEMNNINSRENKENLQSTKYIYIMQLFDFLFFLLKNKLILNKDLKNNIGLIKLLKSYDFRRIRKDHNFIEFIYKTMKL